MSVADLALRTKEDPPGVALSQIMARGRVRGRLAMLGPSFVAAVAYVDPGNFATNVQSGARFGYQLLWVVVAAGLMAMPVQYLSAKLGIVTGRDLAQVCGDRYRTSVRRLLWVQAELVAAATDLAEFVGAAIGLNLLFGLPLPAAGLVTAVIAFGLLGLQSRGFRPYELAITGLLAIVAAGFLYQTLRVGPDARGAALGLIPSFGGNGGIILAAGIVGATVMPHVVYLHSALTSSRVLSSNHAERRRILRFERYDILIALGLAGLVNAAMLVIAADLFHNPSYTGTDSVEQVHAGLGTLVGGGAALAFAVTLLASGLSSSSVGTHSGQVIMSGFLRFQIPLALRRLLTMLPALAVLTFGIAPTTALVFSQVLLSFGIPFAVIPLVRITSDPAVMGIFVNRRATTTAVTTIAAAIIALNTYLLFSLAKEIAL